MDAIHLSWSEMKSWIEGDGFILLMTEDDRGVIIPTADLPVQATEQLRDSLTSRVAEPIWARRRIIFSERGQIFTWFRWMAVLLVFLALTMAVLTVYASVTADPANRPTLEQVVD